jgi:predicted alpha/beta-fold hydrolase
MAFSARLMRRFRRKAALFPAIYEIRRSIGPVHSLREFDNKIVARYCGFRDADDYYYRAASARVVDRIAVPTLILRAGRSIHPSRILPPKPRMAPKLARQPAGDGVHWADVC